MKIKDKPRYLDDFFPQKMLIIIFYKKMFWATFWAMFFENHLVTLRLRNLKLFNFELVEWRSNSFLTQSLLALRDPGKLSS
jgi:hypothetical protein